jgi:alginate O-acetyltransferase complex protein AlgI
MLFCSQRFLLFFAVVFALYWVLPWRQPRVWLLLAASFYFYACRNRKLAFIICASTLLDYILDLGMEHSLAGWRRKLLLGASLVANLGSVALNATAS